MFGTTSRIDTELVERHGKKGLSQVFFFFLIYGCFRSFVAPGIFIVACRISHCGMRASF